jgi:hypothetical protein
MTLVIAGRTYQTRNWSIEGFQLSDLDAGAGGRIDAIHIGPEGVDAGALAAEQVWRDGRGRAGFRLLEIDGVAVT